MKFEIDLGDLLNEYDTDETHARDALRAEIVDRAATQLLTNLDPDERHDIIRAVQRERQQIVHDRLVAQVTEALAQPIRRTSPWGESQGEPVTVLELIRQHLEKFLTGHGSPMHDRFGGDKVPQNLTELVQQATRTVMTKELTQAVNEAKAKISDEVRTKALSAAVAALAPDPKKVR